MIDQIYNYVVLQLHTNQFFSGAALSAIGLSVLYPLKSIPINIWIRIRRKLMFNATVEQETKLFKYLDLWLAEKYPNDFQSIEVSEIDSDLVYSHENDYIYIWKDYRYIRISKTKQSIETPGDRTDLFKRTYRISGLLSKKSILNLLTEVQERGIEQDRLAELIKKDIKIFINSSSYESWRPIRATSPNKAFDDIYLSNKLDIVSDLDNFIKNEPVYRNLKVPFKRGYLFYGPPGTGKSTLAWAIADRLKYDIYLLDLASVTNAGDFKNIMSRVPNKSVVVIEDIDSFYDMRVSSQENKIPFSTFINALSGINQLDESITIITTNHIDKVDPAILRSGRCDAKFEISPITIIEAQSFLQDKIDATIKLESFRSMPFVELQGIAFKHRENIQEIKKMIGNE